MTLCEPCQALIRPTAYVRTCPRCLGAVEEYKRLDDM